MPSLYHEKLKYTKTKGAKVPRLYIETSANNLFCPPDLIKIDVEGRGSVLMVLDDFECKKPILRFE